MDAVAKIFSLLIETCYTEKLSNMLNSCYHRNLWTAEDYFLILTNCNFFLESHFLEMGSKIFWFQKILMEGSSQQASLISLKSSNDNSKLWLWEEKISLPLLCPKSRFFSWRLWSDLKIHSNLKMSCSIILYGAYAGICCKWNATPISCFCSSSQMQE